MRASARGPSKDLEAELKSMSLDWRDFDMEEATRELGRESYFVFFF